MDNGTQETLVATGDPGSCLVHIYLADFRHWMDNGELLFMLLRGTLGPWLNTWLPASTLHNGKWKT